MTALWNPCTQMKDHETLPPLKIKAAQGNYLILEDNKKIIDAISSWWCKSLGHAHPRLFHAMQTQAQKFEHVMLGNASHDAIETLSQQLIGLSPQMSHVMYASDGSCAVDTALKLSVHYHKLQGREKKTQFVALQNSYHGETGLSLAVSDLGIYKQAYQDILRENFFINHIPYVTSIQDPLWSDASEAWKHAEIQLNNKVETLAAIIVEPLLQGAGGMKIYSRDFLKRLEKWAKDHHIHLIVDEILTGFGRTGHALASEYAGIQPDLICAAKGLTAGYLPLSAVIINKKIYDAFYNDYSKNKNFLHSHTHSGNALAVAVANETLEILEQEKIYSRVLKNQNYLEKKFKEVCNKTHRLKNMRAFGWMVAAELITEKSRGGFEVQKQAFKRGALLRPLGNTLYWLPPLNCSLELIDDLCNITIASIENAEL